MNRLNHVLIVLIIYGNLGCIAASKPNPVLTLADRYEKAFCAVVQIVYRGGSGTGFFISGSGDVLTASHVALDKVYSEPSPGQIQLFIDYKPGLRIVRNGEQSALLSLPKLNNDDVQRSTTDLVILKTGLKSPCFIPISLHPSDARIGQHVIAIGFPMSAPTGALYEGFVSAQYRHLPIPVAVVNNKPLFPNYDVLRIQMPITPGASGAPVIADDGDVIGVVSENPTAWFNDLSSLIEYGQRTNGGFNAPESDGLKLLAKLAWVVQEFVTSGAGLAVPTSYLQVPGQKASSPDQPKAKLPESQPRHGWFRAVIDHLK